MATISLFALLLSLPATVFAQATAISVNDPSLIYSGPGVLSGVGWSGGDPSTSALSCNGSIKATANENASVSLLFTGATVTVNFLQVDQGSTATVLMDGNPLPEVHTNSAGVSYQSCQVLAISPGLLPPGPHNVTVVKDQADGFLYLHSFEYNALPPGPGQASGASYGQTSGGSMSASTTPQPSGTGHSLISIVAAVTAVILLFAAIGTGLFFLLRHRRRPRPRVDLNGSSPFTSSLHGEGSYETIKDTVPQPVYGLPSAPPSSSTLHHFPQPHVQGVSYPMSPVPTLLSIPQQAQSPYDPASPTESYQGHGQSYPPVSPSYSNGSSLAHMLPSVQTNLHPLQTQSSLQPQAGGYLASPSTSHSVGISPVAGRPVDAAWAEKQRLAAHYASSSASPAPSSSYHGNTAGPSNLVLYPPRDAAIKRPAQPGPSGQVQGMEGQWKQDEVPPPAYA